MPTCTELERELLDELSRPDGNGKSMHDLRVKVCVERLPPELRERLVTAVANARRWAKEQEVVWEMVRERGVLSGGPHSVEWNRFYDEIASEARKRNGEGDPEAAE